ncbi:cytochrome P450 CYP82D47-like [Aristolochia californica]|uniref:cytochrome P450 CYP82D47-like n=1 Tax=Aristolochia californica TaxID=171875 RepID=UPI0035D5C24B
MEVTPAVQAVLLLFASVLFLWALYTKRRKSRREAPEAAGRWPIIGHLPQLGGALPVVRTLGALADKYGPVFTIWIGVRRAVVVSSWELAKECFTINDKALASRPSLTAGKYLAYNNAIFGISPYGNYWRQARKIATFELLSSRQLESLKGVRVTEIDMCINDLYRRWEENQKLPTKVEIKQWFADLIFNNIVMAVAGRRYFGANIAKEEEEQARRFHKVIHEFFYLGGVFVLSDAVPSLEWLDVGGHISAMKKTGKELDSFLSAWLEEHRQHRLSGHHTADQDFIDVMLSTLEKSQFPDYDPDTVIKAISLTLVLAGTDTTIITLTWALALLMNNRHALQKAQDELDAQIGNNRKVEESDVKNLPYLQAIVKETLRLYPAAPLGIPHASMEDCSIGGYHVPAGTRLLLNIWKIQRDPGIWENPSEFRPERFLSSSAHVDVRGQHFELIPFGAGRRMCPGISFALQVVQLTLARLLHGFEISSLSDEPIDMSESLGLTIPKATPLEVLITPRLSANLY